MSLDQPVKEAFRLLAGLGGCPGDGPCEPPTRLGPYNLVGVLAGVGQDLAQGAAAVPLVVLRGSLDGLREDLLLAPLYPAEPGDGFLVGPAREPGLQSAAARVPLPVPQEQAQAGLLEQVVLLQGPALRRWSGGADDGLGNRLRGGRRGG